jgi:hypothetical protein
MNVPPAMLIIMELTRAGALLMPMPIPIPVDSIKDSPKKMKKIAFFDLVLCWPRDTPREMQAAAWWRLTPIIKFTKVPTELLIPKAMPSKIECTPRARSRTRGEILTPHKSTYFSRGFPCICASSSS